jgi:predicted PurR-regulated permease PerM
MSLVTLSYLNVPFSLSLAILSGFLEGVPTLGPILSAVPATIVAFNISGSMALSVIIAYIIMQLVENHILVPNIMQKAVGLNPVVVIVAIMISANLMGIAGALLAIPFVSFIMVVYRSIE